MGPYGMYTDRNANIYKATLAGMKARQIAEHYSISPSRIYVIAKRGREIESRAIGIREISSTPQDVWLEDKFMDGINYSFEAGC